MVDALSQSQILRVKSQVASGRDTIEAGIFPGRRRANRLRRGILRACGAIAIGIFAAGIAVFLTAVVLNLLFHFTPS